MSYQWNETLPLLKAAAERDGFELGEPPIYLGSMISLPNKNKVVVHFSHMLIHTLLARIIRFFPLSAHFEILNSSFYIPADLVSTF
jgi:hypothetical protein